MHYSSLTPAQKSTYASMVGSTVEDLESKFLANSMTIKSSMYFHIPLEEYKTAWNEYADADYNDSALNNVKFNFGIAGETGKVVYCGMNDDNVFETAQELGSTTNIFCGHDHLNNFSITYYGKDGNKTSDNGITLTYGMSIDYLAYMGIWKKTEQRGGTIINVKPSGELVVEQIKLKDCE